MSYCGSITYVGYNTTLSSKRIDISGGEAASADIFIAARVPVSVDYQLDTQQTLDVLCLAIFFVCFFGVVFYVAVVFCFVCARRRDQPY